ncbi:hypothetical protein R1sor_016939 [Riccia sorocarpa]|uniref:Aminotransferase-like plant mobile domain-containing protein n=1 Tax=Riccia sorocarpa TaxID=122646 RepID=A0ABD3I846_9MARC
MAAQAGAPLHFDLYTEEDDVNYIRWKWISKKEAHRVLRGIDGRLLRRSGLHDALWMDWARPEEGVRVRFCYIGEFVLNWDDRTQSSIVGGREIPLTIDTMREYFLLPEGLNPPRSARHYDELSDWVPQRSRIAKTWYANDVYLPVWRPIIQLINVVLLGKQKPLEVTGAFLYILKNKVGPADEDENLDWATYFKEKVYEEIRACKSKCRPLERGKTCGIVDDEDIVLSDSDKSVEEVTPPRSARAALVHVQSSSNNPDRVQDPSSSSPDRMQDPSSNNPDRVQDPSSSSPEQMHVSSPSSPERGPDRGHLSPDPRDVPSSSNPGRTRQVSPTSPDRQHSPESSPGGHLVLLVTTPLAVGHQAARTAENRLIMNL